MSAEDLYHDALVRLAREAVGAGRLGAPGGAAAHAAPIGAATVDNPLCGDRVTVEVQVEAGRIAALAHQVRGCVLCQAAASLLGRAAPGLGAAELEALRGAATALLTDGAPPTTGAGAGPGAAAAGLAVFTPVRGAPSRHSCVLLPFQALEQALRAALRAGSGSARRVPLAETPR